jgi:hypothetical protein
MKNALLLLLSGLGLMACSLQAANPTGEAIPTVTTAPIASPAITLAEICQQKGYTWNDSNSTCRFDQEGNDSQPTIRIQYPIELIQSEFVEASLDNYLNSYRANFMQIYEETYLPEFGSWFSEHSYTIYHHSPSVVSVVFTISDYTGGAHPNTYFQSFTYDTAANQTLAFEDIFAEGVDPLASIIPIAREKLLAKLAELGMDAETANSFVPTGTDDLADFQNFALSDTDLLLFFGQTQVAPSAAGTVQINIPLSELAGLLRDL